MTALAIGVGGHVPNAKMSTQSESPEAEVRSQLAHNPLDIGAGLFPGLCVNGSFRAEWPALPNEKMNAPSESSGVEARSQQPARYLMSAQSEKSGVDGRSPQPAHNRLDIGAGLSSGLYLTAFSIRLAGSCPTRK